MPTECTLYGTMEILRREEVAYKLGTMSHDRKTKGFWGLLILKHTIQLYFSSFYTSFTTKMAYPGFNSHGGISTKTKTKHPMNVDPRGLFGGEVLSDWLVITSCLLLVRHMRVPQYPSRTINGIKEFWRITSPSCTHFQSTRILLSKVFCKQISGYHYLYMHQHHSPSCKENSMTWIWILIYKISGHIFGVLLYSLLKRHICN